MSTPIAIPSSQPRRIFHTLLIALSMTSLAGAEAIAQTASPNTEPTTEAMLALPDSPGAISSSNPSLDTSVAPLNSIDTKFSMRNSFADFQNQTPAGQGVMAGHLTKYIEPGESVPSLRVGDKVLMGIKDAASPLAPLGWLLAAGYSHAFDKSPNYGTNGRAFAQRLGAAAARGSSEGIFSDSIMASVLHEDPRYYKMGSSHKLLNRAVYAATRIVITRTDGGQNTLNLSYLSGNLAGAALTQAYYPSVNRGFGQVMRTYGGSIGGGALGFLVDEFLDDALHATHLKRNK